MAAETSDGFDAYYAEQISPVLLKLEHQRKAIIGKLITVAGVIAALIAVAAVLCALNSIPAVVAAFGLIPGVIIFLVTAHFMTKDYKARFKVEVIGSVVRFFDPSLQYAPSGQVSLGDFVRSGMFSTQPDRYSGEDEVRGMMGKTRIQFSEVHAEHKVVTYDSKGRRQETWHTIFKGLFFVGDFNKEIKSKTIVHPDVAERYLGRLGKMFQSMSTVGSSAELIKLEDPEFEKYFVVYGEDQVEARYILTPALMRRLIAFRKVTGNGLHLSFLGENVYVGISSSRDMFEPRVFRTVWSKELIEGYRSDMAMAAGIVEELNLNRRIWTKR